MAELALAAYDNPDNEDASYRRALQRGWQPVAAIQLGMRPADFGEGPTRYQFLNGVYEAETFKGTVSGHIRHGDLLILQGMIADDTPTIVLAFRGTDDEDSSIPGIIDEARSFKSFDETYEFFRPVIEAVKAYAASAGIKKFLLTGHSMGAALAQTALARDFENIPGAKAFVFASPGAENGTAGIASDDRIVTFNRELDFIDLGDEIGIKHIAGDTVRLSTANYPSLFDRGGDHSPDLYAKDAADLAALASDPGSAGFSRTQFARAIAAGRVWTGGDLSIVIGNSSDNFSLIASQTIAATGLGNDVIGISLTSVQQRINPLIDGGRGDDRLIVLSPGNFVTRGPSERLTLLDGDAPIANVFSIELVVTLDELIDPDHEVPLIQYPDARSSTKIFTLRPGYDAADGGDGDLSIIGTDTSEVIYIGVGNKTIEAAGGNDVIIARLTANAASSTIIFDGGAGADIMVGANGKNCFIVDDVADLVVGGSGVDEVRTALATYLLGENTEKLTFTGVAPFVGIGNTLNNRIVGGVGVDALSGGGGDDTLIGGRGTDVMTGGAGDDGYSVDDIGDIVIEEKDGGYDTVKSRVDFVLPDCVEKLALAGHARSGTGNALDNLLVGGRGNDVLDGAAGDDTLDAGLGRDRMIGGTGADRFVFHAGDTGATATAADRIADFSRADGDKIVLHAIDADGVPPDSAFSFIGTNAFTGVAGQLRHSFIGGDTLIEGDVNGDGVADLAIRLAGRIALVGGDFTL